MSHSVTIQTRTVTSGSPTSINRGFCRSWTGLLKIAQAIVGGVATGLIGHDLIFHRSNHYFEDLFFFVVVTTFFIGTLIIVLSCLCSFTTESIISKTIYELLYHAVAFCLLLTASIVFLTSINRYYDRYRQYHSTQLTIAAVLGIINSVLYFLSTVYAFRTSRGL